MLFKVNGRKVDRRIDNETLSRFIPDHEITVTRKDRMSIVECDSPSAHYRKVCKRDEELETVNNLVGLAFDRSRR
jgi:hypothetical protein